MRRLCEVAAYFTQLGFTAFGGPAAHITLMERQFVERRRWLEREHFLDMISAINLIPGPNSTQLALSLGYLRAGLPGLLVAGICFIVPAVIIILPLAYFYVNYGQTPDAAVVLRYVGAAVLAVVASAVFRLIKASIKDRFTLAVALLAMIAALLGHWRGLPLADLAIVASAAALGIVRSSRASKRVLPILLPIPLAIFIAPAGLSLMALLFLKIGSTLYGSGYLLLPYLRANFVIAHHWLSERQLLDSVAVGQVTPGPLLTTATFIGYLLGSRPEFGAGFGGSFGGAVCGALMATAAIFAPSFVFVAVLGRLLPRLRKSSLARGALDSMNAAVVSLIGVTLLWMIPPVLSGPGWPLPLGIACVILGVLVRWNVNPTWLILAAAGMGLGAVAVGGG